MDTKDLLTHLGAASFGVLIGWYIYYINRYRKGDVQFSDITTVIGLIGGASVTALFETKGSMFGAYGIGLSIGFFAYFIVLIILVAKSHNFDSDWFLDGRRKDPVPPFAIPAGVRQTETALGIERPPSPQHLAVETAAAAAAATVAALRAPPEARTS
jgi:hypothetical protein